MNRYTTTPYNYYLMHDGWVNNLQHLYTTMTHHFYAVPRYDPCVLVDVVIFIQRTWRQKIRIRKSRVKRHLLVWKKKYTRNRDKAIGKHQSKTQSRAKENSPKPPVTNPVVPLQRISTTPPALVFVKPRLKKYAKTRKTTAPKKSFIPASTNTYSLLYQTVVPDTRSEDGTAEPPQPCPTPEPAPSPPAPTVGGSSGADKRAVAVIESAWCSVIRKRQIRKLHQAYTDIVLFRRVLFFLFCFFRDAQCIDNHPALRRFIKLTTVGIKTQKTLTKWSQSMYSAYANLKRTTTQVLCWYRKNKNNVCEDVLRFLILAVKVLLKLAKATGNLHRELKYSPRAKQLQSHVEAWVLDRCSTQSSACSVEIHKRYVRDWWERHPRIPLFSFALNYNDIREVVVRFLTSKTLCHLSITLEQIVAPHQKILM